jgi:hypothetical protein
MTTTNKQILMYAGGAIVVGAVGFFVYSFFKKPTLQVGNVTIGNDDVPQKSGGKDYTKYFKDLQQESLPPKVSGSNAYTNYFANLQQQSFPSTVR